METLRYRIYALLFEIEFQIHSSASNNCSSNNCPLYFYIIDHYAYYHMYVLQLSRKANKLYYCALCLCHKLQEYKSFGMVKVIILSCFIFCFESFLLPAILASSSTRYFSVVVDDVIDYGSWYTSDCRNLCSLPSDKRSKVSQTVKKQFLPNVFP